MQLTVGRMMQNRSVREKCLCNDLRELASTPPLEGVRARPSCPQQALRKSKRLPGASRCPSGRRLPLEVPLCLLLMK